MGEKSAKLSFGQLLGILLFTVVVLFVLIFFVMQHELEKRDINVQKELKRGLEAVENAGEKVKDSLSGAADKAEDKVEDIADKTEDKLEDILPESDDFSGANAEATFFID